MSWSIHVKGKPAPVKRALVAQFEGAKSSTQSIPHEHAAVALTEEIVEGQLNFLIEHQPDSIVTVSASGYASVAPAGASWSSSTETKLQITHESGLLLD